MTPVKQFHRATAGASRVRQHPEKKENHHGPMSIRLFLKTGGSLL